MWLRGYPPTYRLGMAGGTWAHADLTRAIQRRLEDATAGMPCRVGNQDIELWVSDDKYYFPDAFVICGQPHDPRSRSARDPVLVVEVLSESTAEIDRGDKLEDYLALPSMREYLLLETRKVGGTLYRRESDVWVVHPLRAGAMLCLVSVGLELTLADLYAHTGLLEAD
jgi:Uma2 family endonuclease